MLRAVLRKQSRASRVVGAMRRLGLLALGLGFACGKPPPPPRVPDPSSAPPGTGAAESKPESKPALTVSPRFVVGPGPAGCVEVVGEGFPAIRHDGATIVVPFANHLAHGAASGSLVLQWWDARTGERSRSDPIVPVILFDEFDPSRDCPALRDEIAARVETLNAALAAESWRPLERLPAGLAAAPPEPEDPYVTIDSVWGDRETGVVLVIDEHSAVESMDCTPCFPARLESGRADALQQLPAHPCPDAPRESPQTCAQGPEDDEGFPRFAMSVG